MAREPSTAGKIFIIYNKPIWSGTASILTSVRWVHGPVLSNFWLEPDVHSEPWKIQRQKTFCWKTFCFLSRFCFSSIRTEVDLPGPDQFLTWVGLFNWLQTQIWRHFLMFHQNKMNPELFIWVRRSGSVLVVLNTELKEPGDWMICTKHVRVSSPLRFWTGGSESCGVNQNLSK